MIVHEVAVVMVMDMAVVVHGPTGTSPETKIHTEIGKYLLLREHLMRLMENLLKGVVDMVDLVVRSVVADEVVLAMEKLEKETETVLVGHLSVAVELGGATDEVVNEEEKNLNVEKPPGEENGAADGEKEATKDENEEKEPEDKEMTLEEYGKFLEEKRKALLALKTEERKVDAKEFQAMYDKELKKDVAIKVIDLEESPVLFARQFAKLGGVEVDFLNVGIVPYELLHGIYVKLQMMEAYAVYKHVATVFWIGEWFIKRMPFVRHIYSTSKQISSAISPDQNTTAFKEVAIIRHPRVGEYAFGFITSSVVLQRDEGDEELCSVFVPTNHLYIGDIFLEKKRKERAHTTFERKKQLTKLRIKAEKDSRRETWFPTRCSCSNQY